MDFWFRVPTDNIIDPAHEYLRLAEIGYLESNVHFISERSEEAEQHILKAEHTGIDCEFRSTGNTKLDGKDSAFVAIL